MAESWRVFMVCSIKPIADVLAGTLRELGHEPVAILGPRRDSGDEPPEFLRLGAATAPTGVDLLFARDKHAIERLVRAYEPDLLTCWGFPWKIPMTRCGRNLIDGRGGDRLVNGMEIVLHTRRESVPMAVPPLRIAA